MREEKNKSEKNKSEKNKFEKNRTVKIESEKIKSLIRHYAYDVSLSYEKYMLVIIAGIGLFFMAISIIWSGNSNIAISDSGSVSKSIFNETKPVDILDNLENDCFWNLDKGAIRVSIDLDLSNVSEDLMYLNSLYADSYGFNITDGIHGNISGGQCQFDNTYLNESINVLLNDKKSDSLSLNICELIRILVDELKCQYKIIEIDDGRYDILFEDELYFEDLSKLTDGQLTFLSKLLYSADDDLTVNNALQLKTFLDKYGEFMKLSLPIKLSVVIVQNDLYVYQYTPVSIDVDSQAVIDINISSKDIMSLINPEDAGDYITGNYDFDLAGQVTLQIQDYMEF